jgi:hypothetical protein
MPTSISESVDQGLEGDVGDVGDATDAADSVREQLDPTLALTSEVLGVPPIESGSPKPRMRKERLSQPIKEGFGAKVPARTRCERTGSHTSAIADRPGSSHRLTMDLKCPVIWLILASPNQIR